MSKFSVDKFISKYGLQGGREALESAGYSARKWEILNSNLKEQLSTFDAKNGGNENE